MRRDIIEKGVGLDQGLETKKLSTLRNRSDGTSTKDALLCHFNLEFLTTYCNCPFIRKRNKF